MGAACVHRRTSVSEAALAAGTCPQGQVGPLLQPAWPVCGWSGLAEPGLQVCQVWGMGLMRALRALGLGHLTWLLLGYFQCPLSFQPSMGENLQPSPRMENKCLCVCLVSLECLQQAAGAVAHLGLSLGSTEVLRTFSGKAKKRVSQAGHARLTTVTDW